MSRQVIFQMIMAFVLFTGLQAAAQPVNITLPQLVTETAKTLRVLGNPAMNPMDRVSKISRQKSTAEIVIREHIIQGLVSTDDLNNPNSPLSQAYKGLDTLTILSEMKLDGLTNQVTLDSCARTRSMLAASNLAYMGDELPETPMTRQAWAIINSMCAR